MTYACTSVAIFLERWRFPFQRIALQNLTHLMADLEAPDWLQTGPRAGGPPPDKKGRTETRQAAIGAIKDGKNQGDVIARLVVILARLVLSDSRAIAELTATVYTTWAMDYVEDSFTDEMENAGRHYQEISQDLAGRRKKGEDIDFKARGPPHLHVFMSGLMWLAKQETKHGKETKAFYMEYIKPLSLHAVGEIVLHWQWKRNKNEASLEKKGRLIVAIDSDHDLGRRLIPIVRNAVMEMKGERLVGPAPRGPLERDAAKILNTLK